MTITSADAGRMYPVWKYIGIGKEEFDAKVQEMINEVNAVRIEKVPWHCLKCGRDDHIQVSMTLCSYCRGAYRRKRARVVASMGA